MNSTRRRSVRWGQDLGQLTARGIDRKVFDGREWNTRSALPRFHERTRVRAQDCVPGPEVVGEAVDADDRSPAPGNEPPVMSTIAVRNPFGSRLVLPLMRPRAPFSRSSSVHERSDPHWRQVRACAINQQVSSLASPDILHLPWIRPSECRNSPCVRPEPHEIVRGIDRAQKRTMDAGGGEEAIRPAPVWRCT